MRGGKLLGVLAFLGAFSLACGAFGEGETGLKELEGFADAACACKDVTCLQGVLERQQKWIETHGDELVAASVKDSKRVEAATRKMTECAERIAKGKSGGGAAPASGGGKAGKKGGKRKGG